MILHLLAYSSLSLHSISRAIHNVLDGPAWYFSFLDIIDDVEMACSEVKWRGHACIAKC